MAHLVGTYTLLRSWQAEERVCFGALFHSIYGTNAFGHQSLNRNDREKLRACIGNEAEQLAYMFCSVDRPKALINSLNGLPIVDRLTGETLKIDRQLLCDLLLIECANLIEQGGRSRSLADIFCFAVTDRDLLSPAAYIALKSYLSKPIENKSISIGALS